MEKPKTENLTAWITGRNLNVFQKADAVIEYNKLLEYVKVIEEQLTPPDNAEEEFYCGVQAREEGVICHQQCGGCEDKEARGKI